MKLWIKYKLKNLLDFKKTNNHFNNKKLKYLKNNYLMNIINLKVQINNKRKN